MYTRCQFETTQFTENDQSLKFFEMRLATVILNVLRFVRVCNPRAVRCCDFRWRRALASMSDEQLLPKLRFLITVCSDRVIGRMYTRGVFDSAGDHLGVVVDVLKNRGTTGLAVVRRLMDDFERSRGK